MLLCPNAKVNLGLNIVSRRADGYHNLETIFYPIPLCDALEVEKDSTVEGIAFTADGDFRLDCEDADNLVCRVYRQMASKYPLSGVRVRLTKHIPFGAGLGGGSSDAAYIAVALDRLFGLHLSTEQLQQEVRTMGADCAFFVANSPAFATGIGDMLHPIPLSLRGYEFVLVKPNDIAVNTRTAYQGIVPKVPAMSLQETIMRPIDRWRDTVVNDFESSVFAAYPAIGEVKETLYALGALYASMSGSGASVFGLFKKGTLPTNLPFSNCFVFRTVLA